MRKRLLALLMALAMLLSLVPVSAAADEIAMPEPYAYYALTSDCSDSVNGLNGTPYGNVTIDSANGLTLPGGTSYSTNYVSLPAEVFSTSENLTISTWLKINTNSGNYSALWFGTPAVSNLPTNYWLFNPTNPSGNCKSVFTNSNSASSPWSSEVGINTGNTTQYFGKWAYFTTVITPTSISAYINGKQVGSTVSKTKLISEFNGAISAYIGRSNYLEDPTYAGSFRNLAVYHDAMTAEQVAYDYNTLQSGFLSEIALADAANKLSIGDTSAVYKDIELPTALDGGITVAWESSNSAVISNTGKVTLSEKSENVTLTATLSLNGTSATKTFNAATISSLDVLTTVANSIRLPRYISEDTVLPTTSGEVQIAWECANGVIGADGKINAPETGKTDLFDLKAKVSYRGAVKEVSFKVVVLGKDSKNIISYTRTPDSNANVYSIRIANAMHIAYENGADYTPFHNNNGVLFAKSDATATTWGTTFLLTQPYIFRMKDGSFGVIAVRTNEAGTANANGKLLLFKSEDLISYDEIGLITIDPSGKAINNATCEYDANLDKYIVSWSNASGSFYVSTDDFAAFSAIAQGEGFAAKTTDTAISGANEGNIIAITADEFTKMSNKLNTIYNTTVSSVSIETPVGTPVSLEGTGITAYYSDGSTAEKSVTWNTSQLAAVDFNTPGTYTVNGTVDQTVFNFPVLTKRADPNVQYYNGKYYFISTWDNGQNVLYIRESDTLEGIATATDKRILNHTSSGDMSGCLWAPELHIINGKLYIFFAASENGQWNAVQSRVMELVGTDPTNAADWSEVKRIKKADGSNLSERSTTGITLDMTYFEQGEKSYVCWSQRQISPDAGAQLWVAELDRNQPWIVITDPEPICIADYGWDRNTTVVVEGPNVLHKDGKYYMIFSGSGVDATYAIGMLIADENADLSKAASWKKTNYAVVTSDNVAGEYGPGHNSFFTDPDGNVWNVYHAKASVNGSRDLGIRKVHFAVDGTPILDMTGDREIAPANKTVTATITVVADEETEYSVTADKDMYLVDEDVYLTVVTSKEETKLGIFNEAGKGISQLECSYVDSSLKRTWTVKVKIGSKGNRTISVKALKDGEAFADVDYLGSVDFVVAKTVQPDVKPVKAEIISVDAPQTAVAKQAFTITVKTTQAVANVGIFNENGEGISAKKSYADEGTDRIWTLQVTVSSAGSRSFTVKAAEITNNWLDDTAIPAAVKVTKK